jgi:hypothetical protein
MTQCIHGIPLNTAPDEVINSLPKDQGTIARHRCTVCAYVAGIKVSRGAAYVEDFSVCRHGSIAPIQVISALPIYQGGAGRHKCVHCSYNAGLRSSSPEDLVEAFNRYCDSIISTEAFAETRIRKGQDIFRANLLNLWGGCCAATGIDDAKLLRASHIIPWSKCENDAMRLDKYNGILLSALWDSAFDSGLISFEDEGVPIISRHMSDRAKILLKNSFIAPISFAPTSLPFLEWHRDNQYLR